MDKPVKKCRNFEEYMNLSYGTYRQLEYPCRFCRGSGSIIDPDAVSDVVEGHKFSKHVCCPKCHGSRETNRKTHHADYNEDVVKPYKAAQATYALYLAAKERAKEVLTPKECELLGIN